MGNGSNTLRVLIIYLVLLDRRPGARGWHRPIARSVIPRRAALAAFIPIYYAMYWVAWRIALMIADRSQDAEGGWPAKLATWLLAPAVLAFDIAE